MELRAFGRAQSCAFGSWRLHLPWVHSCAAGKEAASKPHGGIEHLYVKFECSSPGFPADLKAPVTSPFMREGADALPGLPCSYLCAFLALTSRQDGFTEEHQMGVQDPTRVTSSLERHRGMPIRQRGGCTAVWAPLQLALRLRNCPVHLSLDLDKLCRDPCSSNASTEESAHRQFRA
jgi:hypothetical protein